MAKTVEIRALPRDDDRTAFSCGQQGLLHGEPTPMFLTIATVAAAVEG